MSNDYGKFIALGEYMGVDCEARTTFVRVDRIDRITAVDHPNDNPYTELRIGNSTIHVVETPEHVMQLVRCIDTNILRRFCELYGTEEGVKHYLAGGYLPCRVFPHDQVGEKPP